MMKLFSYIAIILLSCNLYAASVISVDSLQLNAEKYYSTKNYKAAIQSYESIIKQGKYSYKLYYNLGNAYYKNKELGKAIYNYELANKLQPNNDDIKLNLTIANEKIIDKIESKENFFIGVIKSGILNALSTTQWAWLSIITLLITLVLIFTFIISNKLQIKRISFFMSLSSIIFFIGSMILGFSALNQKQQSHFGIIIAKEAKVQEEPSVDINSKFVLHEGTKVKVLETTPEWINIKLENGNEGWVKSNDIGLF